MMFSFNPKQLALLFVHSLFLFVAVNGGLLESRIVYGAENESPNSKNQLASYENRFKRVKPVIAVVAENRFTEITDYIVPYGVLSESQVAEVFALALKPEPIQMFPAPILVQPQNTIDGFDALYPKGADYVVVPAVHYSADPTLIAWIKTQANKGATIIGVCDGVWVLAHAGLLDGRKSVGHWYSFESLEKKYETTDWLRNTRFVADDNVITTTGVTASIPVSIALIEAIAGSEHAAIVAEKMGATDWSNKHESEHFQLSIGHVLTAALNWLSFWTHEDIAVKVEDGVDEIALAIFTDSFSRTYLSKAFPFASNKNKIVSKRGLTIMIDQERSIDREIELPGTTPPLTLIDVALQNISELYGTGTSDFVALQLEYINSLEMKNE